MKNHSSNNRNTFFSSNSKSSFVKVLYVLMWTLIVIQSIQQFCQIVFSANDSEELPIQSKIYLPYLMATINVYQSILVFAREELEKNIKKFSNYISNKHDSKFINNPIINEDSESSESIEAVKQKDTSCRQKMYLGVSTVLKSLSIIAKPLQTYLLSLYEVKILLTDPFLLNWPANALQLQIIKHAIASIDTIYDFGTENAATIKSLIKTVKPQSHSEKTHNCQSHSCYFTKVLSELFAISGASTHSAKEAFAFCLLLVESGLAMPMAASISATVFLAMLLQNYAFQGREFVKYTNQFVNYLIGAPIQLKDNYIEIKDAFLSLNTKQKLLLTGLNILIGLLVTLPSAISHSILARLTLKQGANDFWEFWLKEKPPIFYQELISKLSYIGIVDAITDACTESVEAHLKITKQVKVRMKRIVALDEVIVTDDNLASTPKLLI